MMNRTAYSNPVETKRVCNASIVQPWRIVNSTSGGRLLLCNLDRERRSDLTVFQDSLAVE